MTDRQHCVDAIRHVAAVVHEPEDFAARAQAAAEALGPGAIEILAGEFHTEHTPPPELESAFPGLSHWLSARQFAIFEIFYHLREAALPVLRRVAFGEYDWTQGNAIEVLCRLAAEGVDAERTVADLRREIPGMRYEALLYAFGPLLPRLPGDPALAKVLAEFEDLEAFTEAMEELKASG